MRSESLASLEHEKARESEAVRRKSTSSSDAAAGDWLLNVPFAGRGMTNVRVSVGEIYNFSMAVYALDPAPGDLVLDLGAGSCWVSDWLNRLLVDTVSLDFAPDMLRIGQQRLEPGAKQTAGDFARLPLADGSVDGAICLSALHHAADIPAVLREVRRVLKADGRAVFSEPGVGHASQPQSRAEMAELGVMERDIDVDQALAACLEAGFRDVSVVPYLFPPRAYSLAEWRASRTLERLLQSRAAWLRARAARFVRKALRRLPAASPDVADISDVADVPLQSWLLIHSSVRAHPLIVAQKAPRAPDSRRPGTLKARIRLLAPPTQLTAGHPFTLAAEVTNLGDTLWLAERRERGGFVALGAKLLGEDGLIAIYDYGRGYLSAAVSPGETAAVSIELVAPQQPGVYGVKLDMVDEAVAWFEHGGSATETLQIQVVPPA
jgi:SAM-dependent methyltransferase